MLRVITLTREAVGAFAAWLLSGGNGAVMVLTLLGVANRLQVVSYQSPPFGGIAGTVVASVGVGLTAMLLVVSTQ